MQQEAIVEELQAAFPRVPIRADGAFDQWGTTYPDAEPYMKQLDGRSWDQLDREYIVRRSDALGCLGTQHLVSVLPVYLRAMADDGIWSPATGMLTLVLTKPAAGKDSGLGDARFAALVDSLTDPQGTTIARVLARFAESDPEGSLGRAALVALQSHWTSYLPTGA
jgi:hypothetical protein